jgi:hypothetical protein
MSLLPHHVTLEPIAHKYFDVHGQEYQSVSAFFKHFKKPFPENQSYFSARKELRIERESFFGRELTKEEIAKIPENEILVRQQALIIKWAAKNKASTDIGTEIHNAIEDFLKTGIVNPKWTFIPDMVQQYFPEYRAMFPEECLYSKRFFLAGTSDLPVLRKGTTNVINIYDYKTNQAKGITYFSEYKNRLLGPLAHLEECSYIEYCLKMSIYAKMLEEAGWQIGALWLIYIPPANPTGHFLIPVPYMKAEVELMFSWAEHYGHLTKQPQNNLIPLPR